MSFFQKIQKSVYGPDFYAQLGAVPFSHSLRYFLTLNLLLAFLGTIILSVRFLPFIHAFTRDIGPAIIKEYPTALEITITKGILSTNESGPSFIKIPGQPLSAAKWEGIDAAQYENLLVIDPATPPSIEKFREYKTLALATREVLMYETGDGIEFQAYEKIPDTTITKPFLENLVKRFQRFLPFLSPVIVAVIFVGSFAFMNGKLIYLLFGALFVWAIARFKHCDFGYKRSYQIGLHAITSGILVQALLIVYGARAPYLFTAVFILSVLINLSILSRATKPVAPPPLQTS